MALQDLRQNYTPEPIDPGDLAADPFDQFLAWFHDAQHADILEPNAFTLATVSPEGQPHGRTLLLKGVDPAPKTAGRGLVFFTNYGSAKGRDLAENPRASMNFYWDRLARCVRIPGRVSKVSAQETADYFKTRPRASQLGAWCSHQSSVISGREDLVSTFVELTEKYSDDTPIPVPPAWGGYRLIPEAFEFWQGQPSRLHDRLRYLPASATPGRARDAASGDETDWTIDRLSP
ncbi:MAG: pyridoxamine 5'-phosphate oxidase [Planctomycetota bacterium]